MWKECIQTILSINDCAEIIVQDFSTGDISTKINEHKSSSLGFLWHSVLHYSLWFIVYINLYIIVYLICIYCIYLLNIVLHSGLFSIITVDVIDRFINIVFLYFVLSIVFMNIGPKGINCC